MWKCISQYFKEEGIPKDNDILLEEYKHNNQVILAYLNFLLKLVLFTVTAMSATVGSLIYKFFELSFKETNKLETINTKLFKPMLLFFLISLVNYLHMDLSYLDLL